ncbi:MAG TPA: uroporphyrinogen-III synthase, partial [Thermomicrobiales bacterium]|nr:uroporphyrinogen-III synthase [Thermomicrobiales bacterium]
IRQLGADLAALSGACLVAIGPVTARAMEQIGLPVHVIAASPSPEAVVAGCRDWFAATPQETHDPV